MEQKIPDVDLQVIKFVLQKNHLRDRGVQRFSSGSINRVYNLGNKYVLKIEGDGPIARPKHEILKYMPDLTSLLLKKRAKVPRILDFGNEYGKPYILMEKILGNNLVYEWMSFSESRKEKLIAQLAEQLQIWHSISFDDYCIPIVAQEFFRNLQPAIGRLLVKQTNKFQMKKLRQNFPDQTRILEEFYSQNIHLLNEEGTAVLCHQDVHLENVFHDGDKLTAIIDLDWICQAPKDYELWKIIDTFHAPRYTVEEKIESEYGNYQMTKELRWLKKYYPALFQIPHLADRVRLYSVDPLIEVLIEAQNGQWGDRGVVKVAGKIKDFYQEGWLDEALSL